MATETVEDSKLTLGWLKIDSFRGLKGIELDRMASANLLIGGNNSGKSSVLEAVAIFSAPFRLARWADVALARSETTDFDPAAAIEAIRWLFPRERGVGGDSFGHGAIAISGGQDSFYNKLIGLHSRSGNRLTADISRLKGIDPSQRRKGINEGWKLSTAFGAVPIPSVLDIVPRDVDLWSSSDIRDEENNDSQLPIDLLTPYSHRTTAYSLSALSNAVIDDFKDEIVKLLASLEPDIRDVVILTDDTGQRPQLAIRHTRHGVVPATIFGDGIRRALAMALGVRKAAHGILLIDEIEAALHLHSLKTLFPWLVQACKQHKVQLIATTHSLKALDAIGGTWDEANDHDYAAFRLPPNGQGEVKRYTGGMLRRLVHEGGLDIR